jgi:NADPH:quinone reductase-like Zn-dependent oxidoreductase
MQAIPETMKAVVTTGVGDYRKLDYLDTPVPKLGYGQILLQVLVAGVNNTEINTRLGWYSSSVREGTQDTGDGEERSDGGWNETTPFPFIRGTDCCGRIFAQNRTDVEVIRGQGFTDVRMLTETSDFDSVRLIRRADTEQRRITR